MNPRVDEWLAVTAAHMERHVAQITEISEALTA
jgi:hypothetical protein